MGKLKLGGMERIQEYRQQFDELQENAGEFAEETERNESVLSSVEGVDDDTQEKLEAGKRRGREIAEEHAEKIDAQKDEINTRMETVVDEMNEYANRERAEARTVGNMDNAYEEVGASLERDFEVSADEFEELSSGGREIQDSSNGAIDGSARRIRGAEW